MDITISRGVGFFIDLILLGLIGLPIFIITDSSVQSITPIILTIIFFFKDIYSPDGSPGKKILGLKIISSSPRVPLLKWRKVMRNISLIIYPLEIIMIIFTRNKRLGDFLFNTRVIKKST